MGCIIHIVESNYKSVRLYVIPNGPCSDDENIMDFSFTQLAIDGRIKKVEDITVEVEGNLNELLEEALQNSEENRWKKLSWRQLQYGLK